MDNKLKDYDVEICGVCHGRGISYESVGQGMLPRFCPNCHDSPRPGYIIISTPALGTEPDKLWDAENMGYYPDSDDKTNKENIPKPEFRPDEKE